RELEVASASLAEDACVPPQAAALSSPTAAIDSRANRPPRIAAQLARDVRKTCPTIPLSISIVLLVRRVGRISSRDAKRASGSSPTLLDVKSLGGVEDCAPSTTRGRLGLMRRVVAGGMIAIACEHRQGQTRPEQRHQPNQAQLGTAF